MVKYYESRVAITTRSFYKNEDGKWYGSNPAYCRGWKPIEKPKCELIEINDDPSHIAALPNFFFERRRFFGLRG